MLDVTTNDTATALPFDALRVGDLVRVQLDVLAEHARTTPGLPPSWHFLPAGTQALVLGYRERDGESFAILELMLDRRIIMYVREHKLARVKHIVRSSPSSPSSPSSRLKLARRRTRHH